LYVASLTDAIRNPWTLWRQNWEQDSRRDQRRIASYRTQNDCVKEQWNKLNEELKLRKEVKSAISKELPNDLNVRSVFIQEGRTIFQFKKSLFFSQLFSPEEKASFPEEMQTEIVATVSFFCVPTSSLYGLWPYYTPSYSVASDSVRRLGERALAIRAKQLFGD
jgi:hypothetical protein